MKRMLEISTRSVSVPQRQGLVQKVARDDESEAQGSSLTRSSDKRPSLVLPSMSDIKDEPVVAPPQPLEANVVILL